jgi:sulfite reductase alpha subunit-like flavoprotein
MLNPTQQHLLEQLLSTLSRDQQLWLSGYLQGMAAGKGAATVVAPAVEKPTLEIFYATETGNSKGLSLQVMKAAKQAGYKAKNTAVNRLKPETIATDNIAIFIISTHGEGTPPESAHAFFEAVKTMPDGTLTGLSYAVLGLGDSSYEIFCGAALTLDKELQRLGAIPFQDIKLLDVDYTSHAPAWINATINALDKRYDAPALPVMSVQDVEAPTLHSGKGYSRLEPVQMAVKDIINLNDIGSNKQTFHIELEPEAPLTYACGDALGVLLPAGIDGKEATPRLYSIASSPSYHAGEVHLTVALATHTNADGSIGYGLASKYLADKKAGDVLDCYVSQNQLFNLPKDDQDAIMIGPGTGIAPFRGFVYERSERGATGRNWVLFGDQYAHCDFLYQAEWQEHLATEAVHHLDLAFSRDQAEKIYVQHKLQAQAKQFIDWVENGAAVYICGNKDPMSRDVERMILEIIQQQKQLSFDAAEAYLGEMEEQGRYVKDVY